MSNPRRMEEMMEKRCGTGKQKRERKQKKVTRLEKKKDGKVLLECPWSKEELPDLGCNDVEVEQSL